MYASEGSNGRGSRGAGGSRGPRGSRGAGGSPTPGSSGSPSHRGSADVVVVGAGHNGLVAARYLARAGLDVLVVERGEAIGGSTTSAALVPEAPSHILGPCAADIITMRASTILADLDLRSFGYRAVDIDPAYLALSADGGSLGFWRDPRRTADDIRRFSARDAATFLDLMRTLGRCRDFGAHSAP